MAKGSLAAAAANLQQMDEALADMGVPDPDAALLTLCPPGWFRVDDDETPAPDSGRPCWLTTGVDGEVMEGYLRHSRRRAKVNGLWEEYTYWALVSGGGAPVPFTPRYWRPSNALVA